MMISESVYPRMVVSKILSESTPFSKTYMTPQWEVATIVGQPIERIVDRFIEEICRDLDANLLSD